MGGIGSNESEPVKSLTLPLHRRNIYIYMYDADATLSELFHIQIARSVLHRYCNQIHLPN